MTIPMPKTKENKITIPFINGTTDLYMPSYVFGIDFEERENIEFEFVMYDKDFQDWCWKRSRLANDIHGKKVKVVLDNDKDHYYYMRLSVQSTKTKTKMSRVTLKGTADPYKYDLDGGGTL